MTEPLEEFFLLEKSESISGNHKPGFYLRQSLTTTRKLKAVFTLVLYVSLTVSIGQAHSSNQVPNQFSSNEGRTTELTSGGKADTQNLPTTFNQLISQADSAFKANDFENAKQLYMLAETEATRRQSAPDRAKALLGIANCHSGEKWNWIEAEALYEKALEIATQAFGECDQLIDYLESLSNAYQRDANYAKAEKTVLREVAILEKTQSGSNLLGRRYSYLAMIYNQANKFKKCDEYHRKAIAVFEQLKDINWIAMENQNYAVAITERGDYSGAEILIKDSIAKREQFDRYTRNKSSLESIALPVNALADLYMEVGRLAEARELYERALKIREETEPADHPYIAYTLRGLSILYQQEGNYAKAEETLERVRKILEKEHGVNHYIVGGCIASLARCAEMLGNKQRAEELYRKSLDIAQNKNNLQVDHPAVCSAIVRLADFYSENRQQQTVSLSLYEDAIRRYQNGDNSASPDLEGPLRGAGRLLAQSGDFQKAEFYLKRATDIQLLGAKKGSRRIFSRFESLARSALKRTADDCFFECQPIALSELKAKQILVSAVDAFSKGKYRQAKSAFEHGSNPVGPSAAAAKTWLLGLCCVRTGDFTKAQHCVDLLLEFKSSANTNAYLESLSAEILVVDSSRAIFKALSKVIDTEPKLSQRSISSEILCGANFSMNGYPQESWIEKGSANLRKQISAKVQGKKSTISTTADFKLIDLLMLAAYCEGAHAKKLQLNKNAEFARNYLSHCNDSRSIERLLELSDFARFQGEYGRALSCAQLALEFAKTPLQRAETHTQMAEIDVDQQDFDPAFQSINMALQLKPVDNRTRNSIAESLLLKSVIRIGRLSGPKDRESELKSAFEDANRALSLVKAQVGTTDYRLIPIVVQLAGIQLQRKEYKASETLLQQAYKMATAEENARYHLALGQIQTGIGEVYLRQHRDTEALTAFKAALEIHQKDQTEDGVLAQAQALNGLAILADRQNHSEESQVYALNAAGLLDKYFHNVYPQLSFAEQCAFAKETSSEIDFLLSYSSGKEGLAKAFGYLLRWQGMLIESLRRQSVEEKLANTQEFGADMTRRRAILGRVAQLRQLETQSKATDLARKKSIERASEELESLERKFAEAGRGKDFKDPAANMDLKKFQSNLKQAEAFIDIVAYLNPDTMKKQYAVLTMQSIGEPIFTKLDYSKIQKISENWRNAIILTGQTRNWHSEKKEQEHAKLVKSEVDGRNELKSLVWDACTTSLPSTVNKIWICPDGDLTSLPLSMFTLPDDPKQLPSISISVVDSPREFLALQTRRTKLTQGKPTVLLAGGIFYGGFDTPLENTYKEIKDIASGLNANSYSLKFWDKEQPTKKKVLEILPQSSLAHFATHGFYADENDSLASGRGLRGITSRASRGPRQTTLSGAMERLPLVDSGIVLSAQKSGKSYIRSTLTAAELVGLDLSKCDLITLSACETGLGQKVTGQGVLGLRAAILAAGAECSLMSLWNVDDKATHLLMKEFYHQLSLGKTNRSEALAAAQQQVRKDNKDWTTNPSFWAGWTLAGRAWER